MYLSPTMSFYIGRQFLVWLGVTIMGLSGIVFVFDLVELLRRAAKKPDVSFDLVLQMGLLKLPNMIEVLLPFAVLFGAMATFARMTRSQELVVARASGVSVWQFMMPPMALSFGVGLFLLMVFNPIASAMFSRYEQLEARYLKGEHSQIAVMEGGVWLRQSVENNQAIIHAARLSQKDLVMQDVSIFQFKNQDTFVGRMDAETAYLSHNNWELRNVWITNLNSQPTFRDTARLKTNLTKENILNSFSDPETLSFWALPGFISVLEKAGFSATRHRLHLNALIAIPILLCAMVLIAASFSLKPPRRGRTLSMIVGGVFTGFLLFFINDLVTALGMTSKIPILMAAWTPSATAIMLGVAFLLHAEDG